MSAGRGLTASEPPEFHSPGSGAHYSDSNADVLGRILELATGRILNDLLQTRIVEHLELTDTFYGPAAQITPKPERYRAPTTERQPAVST